MKNFEAGSVLAQRDYIPRSKLGTIAAVGVAAFLLVVAFVLPLLG